MSVPRRLLRRAVDRNTVRRVAREALRSVQVRARGSALMLKLKRLPEGYEQSTQRARKTRWRAELDQLFSAGLARS
jgi:RNase P protein component